MWVNGMKNSADWIRNSIVALQLGEMQDFPVSFTCTFHVPSHLACLLPVPCMSHACTLTYLHFACPLHIPWMYLACIYLSCSFDIPFMCKRYILSFHLDVVRWCKNGRCGALRMQASSFWILQVRDTTIGTVMFKNCFLHPARESLGCDSR